MFGKFFNFAYALNLIFQATFSFVVPAGLFIGGAWCLVHYCSVGKWIFIPGIVIGVITGVFSLFKYAVVATDNMPEAKERLNSNKDKKFTEQVTLHSECEKKTEHRDAACSNCGDIEQKSELRDTDNEKTKK